MFQGRFHYRCRLTESPLENNTWPFDETNDSLCNFEVDKGRGSCSDDLFCHKPGDAGLKAAIDSPEDQELINFGITTFDNVGVAMMTIF